MTERRHTASCGRARARSNDSGQYRIADGTLSYQSDVYGSWELSISEITAIGEYTNQDGPFADDYFLAFLAVGKPGWFEASFYGDGRDDILKKLSNLLACDLSCGLAHSTTFASRFIWPDQRKGEELFDFQPAGWLRNRQILRTDAID